jgi:2-polyprenyl-6-hydroxyphenyl methylase/3-demethylubiquinone-9 3-methyltransferase
LFPQTGLRNTIATCHHEYAERRTMNADPAELQKFSDLAHRWWDPESDFKPLHQINPLRLDWIDKQPARGKKVVDIGCGGGILAESMAARGAQVTVDLSEKALGVARLHLFERPAVDYRHISAEDLAREAPPASTS